MIAVDTNLLIYAHRTDLPLHAPARRCLEELAANTAAWAIPWPCLHEFFAVTTNRRAFAAPTSAAVAIATIDGWLAAPRLHLLHETKTHWSVLRDLVRGAKLAGPIVHDARIAALCLQHGVHELWSADRDFKRFPQLKVRNPLLAAP